MLIHELTLQGLLSFGPNSPALAMKPLNVLIGPNGSGKSNLLEAIGLLRSAAIKLTAPLRGSVGGGVTEWIWKCAPGGTARIDAVIEVPDDDFVLQHKIEFTERFARFELVDELIECASSLAGHVSLYRFQRGQPVILVRDAGERTLQRGNVALDESILSQLKDPDLYPELAYLSTMYGEIRLYREWSFGRTSIFRIPQSADLPSDRLEEDLSNLGLFLNSLRGVPKAKNKIIEHLRDLYEGLNDFDVRIKGGTVEVFLTERDYIIPASRLSDGTLRYLCLLAILCDPTPPPRWWVSRSRNWASTPTCFPRSPI